MHVTSFIINITTEDPRRMMDFYENVLRLPRNEDVGEGAVSAAGATIIFDTHSETKGPNNEPSRFLLNFFVDDLATEQQRLEAQGVRFIRSAGREFWGGVISTFTDPDGNYLQLIQFKPQGA